MHKRDTDARTMEMKSSFIMFGFNIIDNIVKDVRDYATGLMLELDEQFAAILLELVTKNKYKEPIYYMYFSFVPQLHIKLIGNSTRVMERLSLVSKYLCNIVVDPDHFHDGNGLVVVTYRDLRKPMTSIDTYSSTFIIDNHKLTMKETHSLLNKKDVITFMFSQTVKNALEKVVAELLDKKPIDDDTDYELTMEIPGG